MRATIQHIERELKDLYPATEIRAFTRLILEHVCGLSFTQQVLTPDQPLAEPHLAEIIDIVERLKNYEPIQYILGETEFAGLKLKVNPSVLIPRPETEELVFWIAETRFTGSPRVIDLGTGSGCIALALKKLIPRASVAGVDISEQATVVASDNAASCNLDVEFYPADILHWESLKWQKYDCIVSNPPYVRDSERAKMEPNVLNHEPENALFVPDNNPLLFYNAIAEFASTYLNEDGWLFFEINENLENRMLELVKKSGFKDATVKKDLSGKPRMLRCRK